VGTDTLAKGVDGMLTWSVGCSRRIFPPLHRFTLERLKAFPWILVDWHMHMWRAPVADHKLVPSLLEKGILKTPMDWITWQTWHPGYVDYYVYRTGERAHRARAQQFVISRVQDASAMCDVRLRSWIKQNNIELVNFRDALYRSDEYQNHLKATGSDLAMI
jgi:hypothetical protein